MKNTIVFNIETLLFGIENARGNIEQVLFAKKMADDEGVLNCNRLAKLSFGDDSVHKALSEGRFADETLVLGYEGWNDSELHLCIRIGRTAIKIATGSFPSEKIVHYEDYKNAILLNKLSEKQIGEVFHFLWCNMGLIQPHLKCINDNF